VSGLDIEGITQRGWPVVVPALSTTCSDTEREELEVCWHQRDVIPFKPHMKFFPYEKTALSGDMADFPKSP
jgi:hypothetical protein